MSTYRVVWSIDIEADTPANAAREALAIQRDPESLATVFHVFPWTAEGKPGRRYFLVDTEAGGSA